jgi:PTS system nitrogen regulatory IIA component
VKNVEEDFDIHSLATYLHLTPDQIRRMAEKGKLPGRRIGGQWRFARAEIHHWFENKIGLCDEKELLAVQRVLDTYAANKSPLADIEIEKLLTAERILVPLSARTKNSVIAEMCRFSADAGLLWDQDKMADAINAREQLHPTALENGVALLHPRRPQPQMLAEPFLALGITASGIPFGGPRGSLTDIFFLIASGDEATHLRVLARLSRLIQSSELLAHLRQAPDAATAMDLISQADQKLA